MTSDSQDEVQRSGLEQRAMAIVADWAGVLTEDVGILMPDDIRASPKVMIADLIAFARTIQRETRAADVKMVRTLPRKDGGCNWNSGQAADNFQRQAAAAIEAQGKE